MFFVLFVTVFLSLGPVYTLALGHYWRDFNGGIPYDAVVGGSDLSGEHIYIGQVFTQNGGVDVCELRKGVRIVHAGVGPKIISSNKRIKILCGNQIEFHWLPTKTSTYWNNLKTNRAVLGGYRFGVGPEFIGRAIYDNEIKIGAITSDGIMNFVDQINGEKNSAGSYEMLTYNK